MKTLMKKIVLFAAVMTMLLYFAFAAPQSPESVTVAPSERMSIGTGDITVQAQAGNVTKLVIDSTSITSNWAGYYGNVTGGITLDDANNWTLYDWVSQNPTGEVYASNSSVTSWTEVMCVNLSLDAAGSGTGVCDKDGDECLNLSEIESHFGMDETDSDGVNETFTQSVDVTVGTTTLSSCPGVYTYINGTNTSDTDVNFQEALLTINNTETIIFTAIVANDRWGFNNQTWDFQMIVGEDGGTAATTPYYFYVELS